MKNCLLFLLILLSNHVLSANTIIVSSDGSGDALTIQAGIDLAVSGDTVLVNEGIYAGDIRIEQKAITLGSLYMVDSDTTHIANTIIDGADAHCGIRINNCWVDTSYVNIVGFTIRNGRSDWDVLGGLGGLGGGIAVFESHARITDCSIYYCRSYQGGGIGTMSSVVELSNNTIYRNVALDYGGGVASAWGVNNQIIFNPIRRNSVYLNQAMQCADIAISMIGLPATLYLDRGTVSNADPYFYGPAGYVQTDILRSFVTQIQQNLWVSPEGSDENSGLSAAYPLQTVSYALAKALPDSLHQLTIHLLSGVYTWSGTKQAFPVQMKSYLTITGESRETVLLDAEDYGGFFAGMGDQDHYGLQNLTCTNARRIRYSPIYLYGNTDSPFRDEVSLENIEISNSWSHNDMVRLSLFKKIRVENVILRDSQAFNGICILGFEDAKVENTIIQNVSPTNYDWLTSYCCALVISVQEYYPQRVTVMVNNCLIADNLNECSFDDNTVTGLGIGLSNHNAEVNVSNCTIANNTSTSAHAAGFAIGGTGYNVTVRNTIVSGNTPHNFCTNSTLDADTALVYFDHCLVEGGDATIYHISGLGETIWLDGNTFEPPLYDENGQFPYMLSSLSPAVNAGTPDTTGFHIPPMDLAGNFRIWDSIIDMGCYEYGSEPYVSIEDSGQPPTAMNTIMQIYPNPFRYFTNLQYTIDKAAETELTIYNLKGQKVKTIIHKRLVKGENATYWDGRDEAGKPCSSGIYLIKLSLDGKAVSSKKVTLVK